MRCFGVAPEAPNAIMCELTALAPAEVPATTTPRSRAAAMALPSAVPSTTRDSRSWFPPVRKIPVAESTSAAASGSFASCRVSGRRPDTRPMPMPRNSIAYSSVACSPRLEAVLTTTTWAWGPPDRRQNRWRMTLSLSLSSAPPMIITGPIRSTRPRRAREDPFDDPSMSDRV